MKSFYIFLIALFFQTHLLKSQVLHVNLNRLTTLDDHSMHVTFLKDTPKAKLVLPAIDLTNAKYFTIFYSWEETDKPEINVMAFIKDKGDELYIDYNNNKDLTDDGPPELFSKNKNDFYFDIVSKEDKHQKAKMVLRRKPSMPDSILSDIVDSDGNMIKKFAAFTGSVHGNLNFKGKKGTFYFDDRVSVRRGILKIGKKEIEIGLFDLTNNGLFNDKQDVLMIDLNKDGRLEYGCDEEIFTLNDIFTIASNNYKIKNIDKYGEWLDLLETEEQATFYYLKRIEAEKARVSSDPSKKGEIVQSFWQLNLTSIENEKIALKDLKGRYVLLNFWGEWCAPCVSEIPELVKIFNDYSQEKLTFISFLKTSNLDKAANIINNMNMDWPQVLLSKDIETFFKIRGYPTNILIFPDGKKYVMSGQINEIFIGKYIKQP